jgi:tRNA pseudouridine32 synthase/23S rRNA pseudouridine746 synthase
MASLGLPLLNDSLYPDVVDVASDDFSHPLALLAHTLEFDDPETAGHRAFESARNL